MGQRALAGIAAALLGLVAAACTSVGERTSLSVGYYAIGGDTFEDIDQQIQLHGPTVLGVGRALAATTVRMVPDFRFAMSGGACRVTQARVNVKAHVTLPRLTSQQRLRAELSRAWDNLEQYARLHESVHVAIADSHALKAEKAIAALEPEPACDSMRGNANLLFRQMMVEHERDQLRFDEEERSRIAALVTRTREIDRPPAQ